ncbi:hypothetical protein [Megamonas funiformis]|uniref:hypothetical protein n=1 Tax=Megamonas funiformis TaxID=437897 RepID=UPI003F85F710
MINPNSIVLVKQNIFESNSAIARIIGYNSSTKEYTITDDVEDFACSRSDFLIHYPHINTSVRVTDTEYHSFPLGTIVKITDIGFLGDEEQGYTNHPHVYVCSYSGHEQYLLRSQFKLIR